MHGRSLCNPSMVGAGDLLRDMLGNWLGGFSCHLRFATSMVAEMCLRLAWVKGHRDVIVELDLKEALRLIRDGVGD